MDIKVFEMSCCSGGSMAPLVEQALDRLNMKCGFKVIDDIGEMLQYGIMKPPALMINGRVKIMGRLGTVEELEEVIAEEMGK